MSKELVHPATGEPIVLEQGQHLWRIDWPGKPVLVITRGDADGVQHYRLALWPELEAAEAGGSGALGPGGATATTPTSAITASACCIEQRSLLRMLAGPTALIGGKWRRKSALSGK